MFVYRELYDYMCRVRNRFAMKLSELPWQEVNKNREASFYSMKNILLHMIDNEDWIVNYAILEKSSKYKRRKSEEYTDMPMVLDHLSEVEKKTRSYLEVATENNFQQRVKFVPSSGTVFDMSVEECLFQSFTEQLYHLGELIALLWQDNIEPPPMQWFRNNPRSAGSG
jgi:uncharacterized damage-inducible protein DinB